MVIHEVPKNVDVIAFNGKQLHTSFFNNDINTGDFVRLKTGGPKMVFTGISSCHHDGRYLCQWFIGKKLNEGWFKECSIKKI